MNEIIPTDEYTEVESRYYLNPQVGLDESNKFIENLRSTQQQNTAQIAKDTAALGTEVSSNLGGLGTNTANNMGYFTSRYQTPQTNSAVANLRATAQAAALNQALENEQAIWKKRYQDAYRAYQKRQYDKTNTPTTLDTVAAEPEIDTNENTQEKTELDVFKEQANSVLPMSATANKYYDAKTGNWFMLTTPTEFDARVISNSLAGHNPQDGMTFSANGKVFRYDADTDMWYQQTYMFGEG